MDLATVFDAQKQGTTMTIQKGTHGFIDIPIELIAAGFELNVNAFAFGNAFADRFPSSDLSLFHEIKKSPSLLLI